MSWRKRKQQPYFYEVFVYVCICIFILSRRLNYMELWKHDKTMGNQYLQTRWLNKCVGEGMGGDVKNN